MTLAVKERSGKWYVIGRFLGRRVCKSTGLVATKATYQTALSQKNYIERKLTEDGPVLGGRLRHVRTVVDDHIVAKEILEKDTGYKTLMAFRDQFGSRQIGSITNQEVQDWVNAKWRQNGTWLWKGSSLRRELSPLVTMMRHEWMVGNRDRPLKLQLPKGTGERVVYLEEHEARQVIQLDKECSVYPLFTLLITTGGRFHEIAGLTWDNVDLQRRQIVLGTHKGATDNEDSLRQRVVPLVDTAHEALMSLKHRTGYVVRNARGVPLGTNGIQTAWYWWRGIREQLGRQDVTIQDLRHTFASLLVKKSVPLKTVSDLLGHTNINRTNKYAHLSPSTLHAHVAALGL